MTVFFLPILIALAFGASSSAPEPMISEDSAATASTAIPGEGAICAFTIFAILEAIGNRCLKDQHPMFQSDLSYAVGQIGNYIVTNGGMSAAELEELQAQQTEGVAEEAVCKSDWADTYLKMAAENDIGATEIRRDTDKLVSQPGKPTWGTCV